MKVHLTLGEAQGGYIVLFEQRAVSLIELFLAFAKIGCFTFGGGFAMIPLIEQVVVEKKRWLKHEDMIDILAVSQALPGAVAINSATFIGQKVAGGKGAFVATLGVILPSVIIITFIASFFLRMESNLIVSAAFAGVRPAVVALIAVAAYKVFKKSVKDKADAIVVVVTALLAAFSDVHVILLIIIGAALGFVMQKVQPEKIMVTIGGKRQSNDIC